jgi:LssY C-terminus
MSRLPPRVIRAFVMCLLLSLAGCANWEAPADVSDAPLRSRAMTEARDDVHVSAAVLSAADTRRMLGADLDRAIIQPVWIEIWNGTSQPLWLLRSGTDPDYYSPLEVAWSLHTPLASDSNARINEHLDRLTLKNPIEPGATHTGILFTNPQRLTKVLNVDLLGIRTLIPFTLFLPVPDDAAGTDPALFRYPDRQIIEYSDPAALRAALERLQCCAHDASGSVRGDPLNVILVGELADIGAAMVRRNYRRDARADDMAQQVFGRPPDIVLRKQAQAGAPSTSMRVWLAPIRFEGRSVYLVQAGRPVGGRFAPYGATGSDLHDDVDEARNLLIQDMVYSGGLEKLGFVTGIGETSEMQPQTVVDGTGYHTDGLRAVLFLAKRPLSLADVEFLRWVPYLERREPPASEENGNARQRPGG